MSQAAIRPTERQAVSWRGKFTDMAVLGASSGLSKLPKGLPIKQAGCASVMTSLTKARNSVLECASACMHGVPEHQHKVPQEICSHQMYTEVHQASCPEAKGNYYGKITGIRFSTCSLHIIISDAISLHAPGKFLIPYPTRTLFKLAKFK